jgi:hypothetical protein
VLTRLIACACVLAVIAQVPAAMADDVGLSAAERAANQKAYAKRQAQGLAETPRGGRGTARSSQDQQARKQQAAQRHKCQEATRNAQATETGTAVLSSVIGLVPFGGSASGIASAATSMGAAAAGEMARQKSAAAMQQECM